MGRYSRGAVTTAEVLKIDLSYLIRGKYIQQGQQVNGILSWHSSTGKEIASISTYSHYVDEYQIILHLTYQAIDSLSGVSKECTEVIQLEAVPSNLGKGHTLYFVCPQTQQRCRILYRCYDSPIWKSRGAYSNRIYYPSQKSSKMQYANNRFWELDTRVKALEGTRKAGTYRGKPTKRANRIERLIYSQILAHYARLQPESMPLSMRRALFSNGKGSKSLNNRQLL